MSLAKPQATIEFTQPISQPRGIIDDGDNKVDDPDLEKGEMGVRKTSEQLRFSVTRRRTEGESCSRKCGSAPNLALNNVQTSLPPELATTVEESEILQIIDFGFERCSKPVPQAECTEVDQIEGCLDMLSPLSPDTARIFVCNFYISGRKEPGRTLRAYLQSMGVENVAAAKESDVSNFTRLAPQWLERLNPSCLGVKPAGTPPFISTYIQCIPLGTNKLIVLYSFSHIGRQSGWQTHWNGLIRSSISDSYCFQVRNGIRKRFAQLSVLNFLNVALKNSTRQLEFECSGILEDIRKESTGYRDIEIRNCRESYFQTVRDEAQDLADAIEFVISNIVVAETSDLPNGWQELCQDICMSSKQLLRVATRMDNYRERQYNLYLNTLNIHDSESIKGLTALATGFLPLSLGASLLSMQTRFVDLEYLLYDFVGVGLLLLSLMSILYIVLKAFVRTTEWKPFGKRQLNLETSNLTPAEVRILQRGQRLNTFANRVVRGTYIVAGIFIVATFMVGMLDNVRMGLETLGFGAAAAVAFLFAIVLLYYMTEGLANLAEWMEKKIMGHPYAGGERAGSGEPEISDPNE